MSPICFISRSSFLIYLPNCVTECDNQRICEDIWEYLEDLRLIPDIEELHYTRRPASKIQEDCYLSIERGLFGVLRKRKQIYHPACVRVTKAAVHPFLKIRLAKSLTPGMQMIIVERNAARCRFVLEVGTPYALRFPHCRYVYFSWNRVQGSINRLLHVGFLGGRDGTKLYSNFRLQYCTVYCTTPQLGRTALCIQAYSTQYPTRSNTNFTVY